MSEETRPLGGKIMTGPMTVMSVLVLVAVALLVKRFIFGLGAVTNLSDGYPWGIWIAYDVVVGTAFACGGYAMALLVYIFNKGNYHPLVRPALLASMLGYTLAGVSIFFDVGRYWQAYNIILPKYANVNSVMFEVATCIMLYVVVLWIEFSPAFLEKMKSGAAGGANKIMFFFIALGVLLPTMHQSSLGTLMVISGHKLSPLWQTSLIPLLFLISAISMGYSIVVFESFYSSYTFGRPYETSMLSKISALIPWLLGVYLVVRFADVTVRGQLGLVFAGDLQGVMFVIENLLYVVALVMLASPAKRQNPGSLFTAAMVMLLAGAVYRFDVFLVGFNPGAGWHYFPSVSEMLITLGIISTEIIVYVIMVKKLPVLHGARHA